MRNLTLAARMLLKTPFVTAIAVLSLALGIGANAAIFSMFNEILLKPLPVTAPGQLVNFANPGPMQGSNSCNQVGDCNEVFSYPMFRDLEKSTQTPFSGIAGHIITNVSMNVRNEPMTGDAGLVSGGFFPVLGLQAERGRLLSPDDDKAIGGSFVAVISDAFWKDKYGRDEKILGQSLIINGKAFSIVGVAPEGFEGTTAGSRPSVWIPLSMRAEIQRFRDWEDRRSYWVYMFARMKPGMTIETATTSLNAVYSPIINDVEVPLQKTMSDKTLASFKNKKITLADGKRGQSQMQRQAKTPLVLLFSVTAVVLLIACANIANLLLSRGAGRATEMGVRLALGATRKRLIALLLTESVMLAIVGGLASLFVAVLTLRAIAAILPPDASNTLHFGLNVPVILFSGALSIATGLVFGLFPALHSTRSDLISAIRAGAGQIAGGRAAARFRSGLVTAQIALSMGLLIMSGLFLKSLVNVSKVNLGIQTDHVAQFSISAARAGVDSAHRQVVLGRVEQELAGTPGVTQVTEGVIGLLTGNNNGRDMRAQGFTCAPDADCGARVSEIGNDYFKFFGVNVQSGREFTNSDQVGAQRVAIVNQTFVKKFNLGPNAIGKFIGDNGDDSLTTQIVGVVPDIKYSEVKDSIPAVYYKPWRQNSRAGFLFYYVKSALPPEQMLGTLRSVMKRVDPNIPVEQLKTLDKQVKDNIFLDRMISILSSAFAIIATLLAGIGLYGVLSYSVAQRTREIGVRMALGADGPNVRRMVLRQVGVMLLIGGVIGVAASLGAGRAARSMLYQLQGQDPVTLVLAVVLLAAVALVAGFLPARKAAMVDPMNALRYD